MLDVRPELQVGRRVSHYNVTNRYEGTLTLDKFCNVLANKWDALRMGICADRADFCPELICAGNDILWENIRSKILEVPVLHQGGNLREVEENSCLRAKGGHTCRTKVSGGWSSPFCWGFPMFDEMIWLNGRPWVAGFC